MLKARNNLNLAQEPIRADGRSELGVQDLERYRARVSNIMGEVDAAHAAAPDLTLDEISTSECFVQK
jgi:hypothetical protein